jgi:hypothetical protein
MVLALQSIVFSIVKEKKSLRGGSEITMAESEVVW